MGWPAGRALPLLAAWKHHSTPPPRTRYSKGLPAADGEVNADLLKCRLVYSAWLGNDATLRGDDELAREMFLDAARAMRDHGLQAAGYEYINVDGGWWAGSDTGKPRKN